MTDEATVAKPSIRKDIENDERERFYSCGDTYLSKCSMCGSFGTLFHFNGLEEICPSCVISDARAPMIAFMRLIEWSAITWQGTRVCHDCGRAQARGHDFGCLFVSAIAGDPRILEWARENAEDAEEASDD